MDPKDRIIVALDVPDAVSAHPLIRELAPYVGMFKVGLELITPGFAPEIVQDVSTNRGRVFYDGKFNDIPNTVAAAAAEATRLGVAMFDLHCASGDPAMQAAVEASRKVCAELELPQKPLILGVTLLTSLTRADLLEMNLMTHEGAMIETVIAMALLAEDAGLDGVIASPLEIEMIRSSCRDGFLIVTPGIRPTRAAAGDQKRFMTPGDAVKAGADYLVIGRPILKPESGTRVEAAERIAEEIATAL